MNSNRETRTVHVPELRVSDDGRHIVGYAALFNSRSVDLGGFVEVIQPGAFRNALSEKQDVRALIDHNPSSIIGRSTSGTLKLSEDDRGLRVDIDVPGTSYGRDLVESMKRGDVTQMSFAFSVRGGGHSWDDSQTPTLRTLKDLNLYDVSVVTFPAYPATEAAVRSLQDHKHAAQAAPAPTTPTSVLRARLDLIDG